MRRNRLLLPWGLLAGLLIAIAVVEGLNIKPPSLLKKPRNYTTTTARTTPLTTTTTTTTTTEEPEITPEEEVSSTTAIPRKRLWTRKHENDTGSDGNVTTKSPLSGIPQIDYVLDPNLPRELPRGYNLSEYPFFDRVPNDIVFECDGLLDGFYASIFYKCQIYHHCVSGIRYDFLCANYTAFDQRTFICQFVSEVDCANSAKWFFRNEPLYKGRITTTSSTTTVAPTTTVATRRPAGAVGAGRRRRPFRRRRPQYDYYYDEDYEEDEYDDDLAGPGQSLPLAGNRQRKRQRRPSSGTIAAADAAAAAEADDKPIRAGGGGSASVYDRPRVLPKIRRPVPLNERDKYEYSSKGGSTDNGVGEKRGHDTTERPTVPANAGLEKESERPKRPVDAPEEDKPREKEVQPRPRPQKKRPVQAQDDDEYYDDEDYDQPIRTTSRKNTQDFYAPSGGDRDFSRRPAMTGAGRPLRRNRPGRRKPAPIEYDDDYEDDRRPFRSSLDDRRRPDDDRRRPITSSRKRPSQRDDYDRDAEYDRPQSYRDSKRPQSSRDAYERPATPTRDSSYERPVTSSRDSARERAPTPTRDSTYERPATTSRESARERPAAPTRDATYDRPLTSSRVAGYEREPPNDSEAEYDRTASKDTTYERLSGNSKKRTQSTTRQTTYDRPRQERPSSRTNPDYDRPVVSETYTSSRPVASRNRFSSDIESDEPIPAARPAYISTTGRSSYRKRGPEEPVTATTGTRGGITRTTPKVTEPPPLLDDDEYYDDEEEEEFVEELPKRPTGSGRTETGSYQETPVELLPLKPSRKPSANRGSAEVEDVVEEPRTRQNTEVRGKTGQNFEEERETGDKVISDRGRIRESPKERERLSHVPSTGRERLAPIADEGRTKTRLSYEVDESSEVIADELEGGIKTSSNRDQSRPNTNYRKTESIIEQPPLRTPQLNYRTLDESSDELVPQRQGFRPKGLVEATTEVSQRYNNFRRKANQASNIETTKVLPSREDRVVEIAEDVHIAPSSQGRSQSTGVGHDEVQSQVDVELESEPSQEQSSEDASKQLDTRKFISSAEAEVKKPIATSGPSGQGFIKNSNNRNIQKSTENEPIVPTGPSGRGSNNRNVHKSTENEPIVPSGPSGRGYNNRNVHKSTENEPIVPSGPSGRGSINHNVQKSATPSNPGIADNIPHRIELPDINDPEYDVTLNEALHPTRPILLSTEGAHVTKTKIPNYQYRDVSLEPELTGPGSEKTLLTSASQTHVSKAPFPAHAKDKRNRGAGDHDRTRSRGPPAPTAPSTNRPALEYEDHTLSRGEDYDDPPIPTGRGGSTRTYPTTESVFRASQQQSPIILSSRGASGQQFPVPKVNNQYIQFSSSPATGTLRQLEQELAKSLPRPRVNQQQYRPQSQGTIREADFYRGGIDPLTLSLGYEVDYDQATKFRPRRKLVWRDRLHDFYNIY